MNPSSSLNVISYNCKGLKSSLNVIQELCHMCDILLLQETWLYDFDLSLCNSVHKDFHGQGLSSVNSSSGLLAGRPHGGLAIL